MRHEINIYSGTGNSFGLVDCREGHSISDPAEAARRLCRVADLHGLLVLTDGVEAERPRLIVYNADGSRPEACGNGLRCAAWHTITHNVMVGSRFVIETDSGPREIHLIDSSGPGARLKVNLGHAALFALSETPDPSLIPSPGIGVRIGNPHLVFWLDGDGDVDVTKVGAALQDHPDFPHGVNVGFLARDEGGWHLRVYERGVGETPACGTGACAAAAVLRGGTFGLPAVEGQVELRMPGGSLLVERTTAGDYLLEGSVRQLPTPPELLAEGGEQLLWAR